jgi:hypothetical protein
VDDDSSSDSEDDEGDDNAQGQGQGSPQRGNDVGGPDPTQRLARPNYDYERAPARECPHYRTVPSLFVLTARAQPRRAGKYQCLRPQFPALATYVRGWAGSAASNTDGSQWLFYSALGRLTTE